MTNGDKETINTEARKEIKELISNKLNKKLDSGGPKAAYKPFFEAVFNKKLITYASIIQSFYTSFGMSIYEQMAMILAESRDFEVKHQYSLLGEISPETSTLILKIQQELIRKQRIANTKEEIELIKESIVGKGKQLKQPYSVVDLYLKSPKDVEYYLGITTVVGNKEGLEAHKLKLLRWMALRLSQDKNANFFVGIGVPYNPYYPKPYIRWGSDVLFDKHQLLVQEDFWDTIGGKGTFDELIKIFKEVGIEIKEKVDAL
jgi:hypothetical protein